jgi:hypothetical protein
MKTMKLVLEDSRSSESLFLTVNKVLEEREVVELVEPVRKFSRFSSEVLTVGPRDQGMRSCGEMAGSGNG